MFMMDAEKDKPRENPLLCYLEVKLFVRWSLLISFCLVLVSFCSLLVTFCSFVVAFYSLLSKKFWRTYFLVIFSS